MAFSPYPNVACCWSDESFNFLNHFLFFPGSMSREILITFWKESGGNRFHPVAP